MASKITSIANKMKIIKSTKSSKQLSKMAGEIKILEQNLVDDDRKIVRELVKIFGVDSGDLSRTLERFKQDVKGMEKQLKRNQ